MAGWKMWCVVVKCDVCGCGAVCGGGDTWECVVVPSLLATSYVIFTTIEHCLKMNDLDLTRFIIQKLLTPPLVLFGCLGNTVNILVLTRPVMQNTSTNRPLSSIKFVVNLNGLKRRGKNFKMNVNVTLKNCCYRYNSILMESEAVPVDGQSVDQEKRTWRGGSLWKQLLRVKSSRFSGVVDVVEKLELEQ
ncbi:hypothetical protein HELRODRAFT_181974 [Helobdella robusta]|uniref:Uncharacterized protein n=1 Tax=Helobdella robusta TaxID=6412 RepID=T1FHJ9_HELRO|nr:hypothetical protein HELRODRAFT_181974 [Helobdella robusta]ESN91919.1 hypothetical protein HELRODRAFT_181974 [Helobdella robusta]